MGEQAPAGWYPDGHGNQRYWDGSAWTEHVHTPSAPAPATATVAAAAAVTNTAQPKKDGAFAKVNAAVKKAAAEKQAAKDERERLHAEARTAAGSLVTSAAFAGSTVEIYEGGYVRIATSMNRSTGYEKLRSIKYVPPKSQEKAPAGTALTAAGVSSLVKGSVGGLMKSSVPGLVVAGVQGLVETLYQESALTITTDKEVHTLVEQGGTGRGAVAIALESAGKSVLAGLNGTSEGLLTRGTFGSATIEIYEGGYARVLSDEYTSTSLEKLHSIKYTLPGDTKPSAATAVGQAAPGLASGLVKGRVQGLVAEGLRQFTTTQPRSSYLTITTDKQIHSLVDDHTPGINEVGIALEAAGRAVLGLNADARAEQAALEAQPTPSEAPATATNVEKLRQMAELHKDGILSDEEFASAKARILGGI